MAGFPTWDRNSSVLALMSIKSFASKRTMPLEATEMALESALTKCCRESVCKVRVALL